MSETTDKSSNVFGQFVDGAAKQYGMKDGGFANLVERIGGFASVAIPTMILDRKFIIKPALEKTLTPAQHEAVAQNAFGGSLTLR